MTSPRLALAACSIALVAASGPEPSAPVSGRDATRSRVTILDVEGRTKRVVLDSPRRFDAPDWTPDGSSLILNSGGKLWRIPAGGGHEPEPIPIDPAGYILIDHGISPDGKSLAFTDGPIELVPAAGGKPRRLSMVGPSYFQSWSPDGKTVAFTADRGRGFELFGLDVEKGSEHPLTARRAFCDKPDYSPDGRWIYFNSDRAGGMDVWRMPAAGTGPNDAQAERVTTDDRDDWSPHPSPDGKWLAFLSYPRRTEGHPGDRDVMIRKIPLPGTAVGKAGARPEELVRLVGGHGTLGPRPWSPDGRRLAYVSYEPPPPTVRVVFFTPSDIKVPDGANRRLTRVADAAESFLLDGMKRWKYPPAVARIFRREADGSVEVLQVRGEFPAASGKYAKPDYAADVIGRATRQYRIAGEGHVWWIFIDVGDRPTRFGDWRGMGCSRDGGWAMVNYDTIPGEIRPDLGLQVGFNAEFALKGTIHELGHAFGLRHAGPDLALGLGNSLMGPNNSVYAGRKYPRADQVYLSEANAAQLWKHPVFSGQSADRALQPEVKLLDYKARYSKVDDRVTLTGKLAADLPAHSVIVHDDLGRPDDHYWSRQYSARLAADGTFRVDIDRPAKADGHYRISFCFDNGAVTGDGAGVTFDDPGEIRKSYRYRDGRLQFGD